MLSTALKILLGLTLMYIVLNLFRALFVMIKNDPNGPKVSTFLGRRVMLSALVILVILIAMATGIIQPNPRPH